VLGELLVGVGRSELADDLEHGLGAGAASGLGPEHGQLFAGAGLPADTDRDLWLVGLEGERDVGDQRAQQPLAVAVAGGRRGPEARQVAGERFDVAAGGEWRLGAVAGELGLGVLEFSQLGLPVRFEGACDGCRARTGERRARRGRPRSGRARPVA
jgi:hypothetical protein